MLKVYIPINKEFKIYEAEVKELYKKSQKRIKDSNSFNFIKNNTLFYMFVFNDDLVGAIYYFMEGEKLYLNGFAKPKKHFINLQCLKLSTTWFTCPIYAEVQNRASTLCLLRCGFKRVKGNLFMYKNFKKEYWLGKES